MYSVMWHSLVSKCHVFSQYTSKFYLCPLRSTVFSLLISMKPTSVQEHYVQMAYTRFYQTQSINVESTDINSFIPLSIYTFLCTDLYESHKCLMTLRGVLLYQIVSKLDEKCRQYMQSLKANNALVNSVYYVTRYTIYNLVFSFYILFTFL